MPSDAFARGFGWKPLERAELARIAREQGVPEDLVAKDYLQGYVLAGVAATLALDGLRFKVVPHSGRCTSATTVFRKISTSAPSMPHVEKR